LTVLSDDGFFANDAIDRWDHALFLAQLARGHERAWLLYSSEMPSLIRLLWRHAPQLLVCSLLLLGLSLWRMGLRTGPLLDSGFASRRNLLEHLALDRMERKGRCDWIAGRIGLTPGEVETALYGRYSSEQDFIRMSAVQQRLAVRLRSERGARG
jgi:hypothetical protein